MKLAIIHKLAEVEHVHLLNRVLEIVLLANVDLGLVEEVELWALALVRLCTVRFAIKSTCAPGVAVLSDQGRSAGCLVKGINLYARITLTGIRTNIHELYRLCRKIILQLVDARLWQDFFASSNSNPIAKRDRFSCFQGKVAFCLAVGEYLVAQWVGGKQTIASCMPISWVANVLWMINDENTD